MTEHPQLIVMLTQNDMTVENAYELFDACKNTSAEYFGFKEAPLPSDDMKRLFSYMKECGKKTFLEVVRYDREGSIMGAQIAVECGCDYLMGTTYSDDINELCQKNNIKYLPFVGEISDRPSILKGSIDATIKEAENILKKGVFGFDLLGYRYIGDAALLIDRFVKEVPAPVCVAGSINSFERLDEVNRIAPWSYTIGSAFFENCFGEGFAEQIERVCSYMDGLRAAEV